MKIKETLKDPDVNGIVKSVTSRFRNSLNQDELEGCTLNAVSDALNSYDPEKKSKFTTYLHRGLQIQCLTQIKKNERPRTDYARVKSNVDYRFQIKQQVMDVMDELERIKEGQMVVDKFLYNYSNKEIAIKNGIHPETVRIKIKNILEKLRHRMR
tara:strand:- start:25833 stop:26297 length:465 start_codon:yes stop_codon:yes gene_type:complete